MVTPPPIACPFCGEQDFDAVGLKHHLRAGHCDQYEHTPGIDEAREARPADTEGKDRTWQTAKHS